MNFYEIIKTKKLGRGFPDYWTQLFAEHVGGKGEWKVAGVLPLTFTAKGGTAVDWVIEGNNDVGENLFDIPNITVTGYNKYYAGYSFSGTLATTILTEINANIGSQYSWYINIDTEYTGNVFFMLVLYYADSTYGSFINPHKFTPAKEVARVELRAEYDSENGKGYQYTFSDITFVKGSTAPDHYIPYQQGVGERTENLWDGSPESLIKRTVTDAGTVVNTMVISAPGTYTARCFVKLDKATAYCYAKMYNVPNNTYGPTVYLSTPQSTSIPLQTITATVDADNIMLIYDALGVGKFASTANLFDEVQLCIISGSTPPETYIPYGYQIPLTVSQQGQPDKTVDIYIGDSPLTEGETVSKTSTGVDIELFEGENTVSTTLYNKPTMEIKYIKRR